MSDEIDAIFKKLCEVISPPTRTLKKSEGDVNTEPIKPVKSTKEEHHE